MIAVNLGFLWYHFDFCRVNSSDGQAIAKRLCTQITKATGAIKQLVKEYTKQNVDTLDCKYPSTISVEDALNIDSPLWLVLNDDIQSHSTVPYCLKRQLIDLVHVRKRCQEEIANTKEEMVRMLSHFEGKLKVLDAWSKELIEQKDSERARALLAIACTKMDELSVFTHHLHGLFSGGAGGHKECEAQFDLGIFPEVDSDDDDEEVQKDDDDNTDEADVVQQLGQSEIFEDLRSVLYAEYGSDSASDSDSSDFDTEIS